MRVCFISTSLDPGGAETALTALVKSLRDADVQSMVISLRGSGRLVTKLHSHGTAVASLQLEGLVDLLSATPRIIREIRSFKPEIIQGWMYHGNLVAAGIAPLCGGRLLWGVRQSLGALERENPKTTLLIKIGARISARPARIVYNSERARIDHETIGYFSSNSVVIDNGFDTEVFKPNAAARTHWRERLGLSGDALLVGHVARFHPVKDHETFLLAAARIRSATPNAHFLMVGRDVDDSNPLLTSTIERLTLGRSVSLLGEIDDMAELLPALDVVCVTSRSEAFPNVLAEAMSCGVPCVTTDVGDARRIVGETGQIVPPGNPELITAAVLAVAGGNTGERLLRGLAARQRIVEFFSQPIMTARYASLYAECARSQ